MINRNIVISLLLITVLFLNFASTVLAGDNIPSDKEVVYAQNIYKLMKEFNTKESEFLKDIQKINPQDNTQIKVRFTKKFAYTKDYYTKIRTLTPTSKFVTYQKKLLDAVYCNLQYLQKVISELDTDKNFQTITNENSTTQKAAMAKYNDTLNLFNQIINSWQKPYLEKVIPHGPAQEKAK